MACHSQTESRRIVTGQIRVRLQNPTEGAFALYTEKIEALEESLQKRYSITHHLRRFRANMPFIPSKFERTLVSGIRKVSTNLTCKSDARHAYDVVDLMTGALSFTDIPTYSEMLLE